MATDYVDIHEEEIGEKPFDLRLMLRLLTYLKPYASWVALAFVLILITSVARQAGLFLTKIAVDDHILIGDYAGLHRIVLIYLGLLIVQFMGNYVQSYVTQMTGQWAMVDVRHAIFSHLQRLPLKFFDRTPIGRLMTRNTNDVDALAELFTDGIVVVFSDIFTIIAIVVFMAILDVELALITCSVLPLMFICTFYFQGRMLRAFRLARTRLARLNAYLQENISGMEVVQLFNRERRNKERFDEINGSYLDAGLQSTLYFSLYFPLMEMFGAAAVALVIWYGGEQIIGSQIQWGVLVAMLQYIRRFFWPILEISERYAILQAAMASSERIFELLDTEPESEGGDHVQESSRGEIEFENVWFTYQDPADDDRDPDWVLRDVSFRIAPGERVAVVGATGSGKTTIISLLNRFYEIQQGVIRLDGIDIREWDIEDLRRKVAIVPTGCLSVFRRHRAKHPAGQHGDSEGHARASCHRRQRQPLHRSSRRRLRPPRHRTWIDLLGRPASAHRLRTGPRSKTGHPCPRRGYVQCRHGNRAMDSGSRRTDDAGSHLHRHRASHLHDPRVRSHHGSAQGGNP